MFLFRREPGVDAERILAFRLARSGLGDRTAGSLAAAAACPASDFTRDAALLSLAARAPEITRDSYARAVDDGAVVVAHVVRGAIHAVAPGDHVLYGRALLAQDDEELAAQLGRQVRSLAGEHGISPAAALAEVTAATLDALAPGSPLSKDALHAALRQQVRPELMPWCRGCGSHHVAPMLWRYATVAAGARLDSGRRYRLAPPGDMPPACEAVRRFLSFYGPSTPAAFADWAGLARSHAARLWQAITGELAEVAAPGGAAWLLESDVAALESPPAAHGVRLLPPGDPYLQAPNRPLLAPGAELRKRMFRPVASPGAVLSDGRLAGLWRARGRRLEVNVEPLGAPAADELDCEAERLGRLRGAQRVEVLIA